MTTSGHFAKTHCLPGYEPNLTIRQHVVAWSENSKPIMERNLVMDRFHLSFPGELQVTSQGKQTHTLIGIGWLSYTFTGESKASML